MIQLNFIVSYNDLLSDILTGLVTIVAIRHMFFCYIFRRKVT